MAFCVGPCPAEAPQWLVSTHMKHAEHPYNCSLAWHTPLLVTVVHVQTRVGLAPLQQELQLCSLGLLDFYENHP